MVGDEKSTQRGGDRPAGGVLSQRTGGGEQRLFSRGMKQLAGGRRETR